MLDVQDISCFRGCREFFCNLSFQAKPGDAWVFTGQNGAGKSTLLSALVHFFPLNTGHVLWNQKPIAEQLFEFHRESVLIGHKLALKGKETPTEHLERWASYQKCSKDSIPETLEKWDIQDTNKQIRTFSAGQQKRVALSRLLLEPKALWLLDEPTSQLDTKGKSILAELVETHRSKGGIVIACTHEDLNWKACHHMSLDDQMPQTKAA